MKLKPGEIICPKCKANSIVGKGNGTVFGCDRCNGRGKLDWIEAVVGVRQSNSHSALDNTNVKKLISNLEESLKQFEFEVNDKTTMYHTQSCINSILHKERSNHTIYDFQSNVVDNNINICLRPCKSAELININMVMS